MVVTCAAAPHEILDGARVQEAMRHRPDLPMVIIDIAVPRNVDPAVKQLDKVFLYNIDDLTEIADFNRKQRQEEMKKAEEIVAEETAKLESWWRALEVRPVVTALMSKAENIRRTQLSKTLKKLPPLSKEQRASLEDMTRSIITKILNDPIQHLKAKSNGDGDYAEIVRELFRLDTDRP